MRYALIYGALAGAITVAVIILGLVADLPDHFQSEWFGYLVMLVALSMIFVGTKRFRDVERGGVVRFVPAFAVGLGIAAVAGIFYVAGWETFLATTDRDFIAEYTQNIVRGMQADGASPAAIAAKVAEMQELGESYRNPLFRVPLTFIEIFPVGLIVALVSAALLRNPRVLPARSPA